MYSMTKNLILLFASVVCMGCFVQAQNFSNQNDQQESSIMKFDRRFHDFGKVKKGESRTTEFEFTNVSKEPLIIDLVSACDCTTTDYPRLPVQPGEKGIIKVVFDSTEKEESEVIDIDIYLRNTDPETGIPLSETLKYKFNLVK